MHRILLTKQPLATRAISSMAEEWTDNIPFHEFDSAANRTVARQEAYTQLCENDREAFVVTGRTGALHTSAAILILLLGCVGIVLALYAKFLVRLRKVESSTATQKKPVAAAAKATSGCVSPDNNTLVHDQNQADVEIQSPRSLRGAKRSISIAKQGDGWDPVVGDFSENATAYLAKHETAIYCSELCYYPSAKATFPILKQVDVQISYGSLVAVMGPSGSGKVRTTTTLIHTPNRLSRCNPRPHFWTSFRVVAILVNTLGTPRSLLCPLPRSRRTTCDESVTCDSLKAIHNR
jgi:hypothetical protein